LTHIATTGKRFVVRADEKPTAFLELESAISGIALSCLTRFAASRFLLCSLTTNRPFALIHHGRTWSGGRREQDPYFVRAQDSLEGPLCPFALIAVTS
jgi:hypothetical protein